MRAIPCTWALIVGSSIAIIVAVLRFKCVGGLLPIEQAVQASVGSTELRLGAPLRTWIDKLGEPETVLQNDLVNTFFFWPKAGIAVFCHPLFKGQERDKAKADWVVTDIILPRDYILHPYFQNIIDPDVTIKFTKILPLQENMLHEVNSCGATVTTLGDGDIVQAVRITKRDSIFGDYN